MPPTYFKNANFVLGIDTKMKRNLMKVILTERDFEYNTESKNWVISYNGEWVFYFTKKGNKYGYIDLTGKTVIPFRYDEVSDFYADTERASVYSKEGYFWINKKCIILSDVKDTTSSVVSRREDDITKKNINTIKTPVSDYQVHQSNGVLQVKYKDILIGSLVAQNCYFDEKNGVFNVTMNDGKSIYLNPLLKPLFLFEYDYADFWQ